MSAGEPLYWWNTSQIIYTSAPNPTHACPSCGAATCPHCGKALPATKPAVYPQPTWIVPWYPTPYPYAPYVVNQGSATIAGLSDGVTVTYSESES